MTTATLQEEPHSIMKHNDPCYKFEQKRFRGATETLSIVVVGAGGIGSHLIPFIPTAVDPLKKRGVSVSVYDPDIVQPKNLRFNQLYTVTDLFEHKAKASAAQCTNSSWHACEFNPDEHIPETSAPIVYILCVDDSEVRRSFYQNVIAHNAFWIDARAEGNGAQVLSRCPMWDDDLEGLCSATLPSKPTKTGCVVGGVIDFGHMVAAAMALQALACWCRGEEPQPIRVANI